MTKGQLERGNAIQARIARTEKELEWLKNSAYVVSIDDGAGNSIQSTHKEISSNSQLTQLAEKYINDVEIALASELIRLRIDFESI